MLYLNAISFVSFKPSVLYLPKCDLRVPWFHSRGGSWMLLVSILNFFQDSVCLYNEYKMMREIIVVSSYFCLGLTSLMRILCWSIVVMICCLSQCTCRSGLACYSHNETCNGLGPWWRFLSCTSLADGESALSTVWESSDWLGLFQNGNYCWGGCSTSPWKRCSRSLCRLTVGSINPSKDYRWWLPFCCCSRRIWGSCKEEDLSSPFQSLQTGTMCANMHKSLFTQ
jgi:hypothetical protein